MNHLFESVNGKTLIIIAHRIRTVMKCNKIMVIESGKIIEFDQKEVIL